MILRFSTAPSPTVKPPAPNFLQTHQASPRAQPESPRAPCAPTTTTGLAGCPAASRLLGSPRGTVTQPCSPQPTSALRCSRWLRFSWQEVLPTPYRHRSCTCTINRSAHMAPESLHQVGEAAASSTGLLSGQPGYFCSLLSHFVFKHLA